MVKCLVGYLFAMPRLFSPRGCGLPWFGVYVRSPLAAMLGPPQALPFADDQELGEACHAVAGFTQAVPTVQQMHSLLLNNLMFALRCAASRQTASFLVPPQGVDAHFRCLLAACEAEPLLSRLRKCACRYRYRFIEPRTANPSGHGLTTHAMWSVLDRSHRLLVQTCKTIE